jgi:hypothetical protein
LLRYLQDGPQKALEVIDNPITSAEAGVRAAMLVELGRTAVPMLTPRSTIRADADRFRSSGNNPVSFIFKGDTQNFDPWAG